MEKILQNKDPFLVSIVTEPDCTTTANNDRPAIILLNAGLVHRAGPFRMSTHLARAFSQEGFLSVRMDASNIGDSDIYRGQEPYQERLMRDIQINMDLITEKYGNNKFIIMGLCTGADNAHKISVRDERVVGAVFLDGYRYPTPKFYLKRYIPFLLNPGNYLPIIKKLILKAIAKTSPSHDETTKSFLFTWRLPPKQSVEEDFKNLIHRNVKLCFMFTGGARGYFNYSEQMQEAFKSVNFLDNLSVDYMEYADHCFMLKKDRDAMSNKVNNWLKQHFA